MSEDDRDADDVLDELREMLDDEADLDSTAPRKAFDLWMQQQQDAAESTLQSYRYRVRPFLQFCEEKEIDDLNEVTTRDIKEFEARRWDSDLQRNTLNNQFGTLRQFLTYCRDLNAVSDDVVTALDVPDLSKEQRVNTEKLITDRAQEIIENLDRYRYASRDHVLTLLLWRTTARIGTIRSLDLEDVYLDEADRERLREELESGGYANHVIESILAEASLPFLYLRHRPESETPLKNQEGGERIINIAEWVADVLRDFIRVNRDDVTDEYGREPLLSSQKGSGRLSDSAIRNWIYIFTQPCEFGGECPHDRDPEECEARVHGHGSTCPSSRSPHKIRTGSITHHRDQGWPVPDLAEKANTSEELIEGVYDQPEQLVRGASRRSHLDKLDSAATDSDDDS
ncbi:site-specific integrase [Halomicroarcula limicola]|uniref:Site-specific integrase n=1 Tax=Haloarcula limicola TaxID=1429915 RepID=A0A8J8C3Z9_9EURY|nr:site-specific integrase [Halomicroarcula limicola]MBV0925031.1 site-specific integrase [Halomicroarcula limicola]